MTGGRTEGDAPPPYQLVLAPHPRSAQVARTFVETCCRAAGISGDPVDVAVLLTSETVTNAIIHARSVARLVVTVGRESLRVEVGDDDPLSPELVGQSTSEVSGRGLSILDMLADSWGVTNEPLGKVVWFCVRTS